MTNALKHIRSIRGMYLVDVAARYEEITGHSITPAAISHWENGTAKLSAENALVLADIYQCSLDVLLGRVQNDEIKGLHNSFYSLPENEQKIVQYAFADWTGDIHSLINLMGAYMSLPIKIRAELSWFNIKRYKEEKNKGNVTVQLPVNDSCLEHGLDNIMRKG